MRLIGLGFGWGGVVICDFSAFLISWIMDFTVDGFYGWVGGFFGFLGLNGGYGYGLD